MEKKIQVIEKVQIMEVEPLMKVKDLCDYFRVTRGTIEKWRKNGMPEISIAGNPRYKRIEVEEWLQNVNAKDLKDL